jgi:hypothetical protein
MYLGERRIRSAGRTSGSIEITIPTELQALEGVSCSFAVRDGPRPEIVLQPDLAEARTLFCSLWERLRIGLAEVGEIDEFSLAPFALALFPSSHWRDRPPLAYSDALTVLQRQEAASGSAREAMARTLAFLAVVAGRQLGLQGDVAVAFGDAVGYLVTGIAPGLGADFERGMADRLFAQSLPATQESGRGHEIAGHLAPVGSGSPMAEEVWLRARPGLCAVYDQFRAWQEDHGAYKQARENWYRALTVEMGMRETSVEGFLERRDEAPLGPEPSHHEGDQREEI